MIIEEGLIAIGILALIAAIFMLRGKGKTSRSNQQIVHQSAVSKQVVDLARPSVSPNTQAAPFSVIQEMEPVSACNGQMVGLTEPTVSTNTQAALPVQATMIVAQTPVWESQLSQTKVELTQPGQAQVADALNGQLTAKPDRGLPEAQTQSSIPSGIVPLSPLKPVSRLLPNPLSIDQQMAELIEDVWVLQQQVAEIGRRLNYLSTSIQHSRASTPNQPGSNGRGDN